MFRRRPSQIGDASRRSRHHDHPAVDHLDVAVGQVRPDRGDLVAFDHHIPDEVANAWIEAEDRASPDEHPPRRRHTQVGATRVEGWDGDRLWRTAA